MRSRPYELQLPFDDGAVTGFPSLRDIYAASEAELASVVGAVAAARIRWFLDAPLDTRLAVEPDTPASVTLRTAA
jgi:hypothetical protein